MANKGVMGASNPVLRDLGNGLRYTVECVISYLPTNFQTNGVYCEIDPTQTVAAINNTIQQFGMDQINAEVPGAITNKNDVILMGGRVS